MNKRMYRTPVGRGAAFGGRPGHGGGAMSRGISSSSKEIKPGTLGRLMSYLGEYKLSISLVIICILLSTLASVASSLFLQILIDDYITPLLLEPVPVFDGLLRIILIIGGILLLGVLATFIYNRVMVVISQGILRKIRDQMFSHMQSLPVSYFDTNSHGDVMSHYTNDTDALRQMLAQSVPNMLSSALSVVLVFIAMMYISLYLTLFVVVFVVLSMVLIKSIAGKSGAYFVRQQESIGDVNGFVEEMINGQKVVKVFCHEEKVKQIFDDKNDGLRMNSTEANRYSNVLMPVTNAMGYILYVCIAIVGSYMAIAGVSNYGLTGPGLMSLGLIASFLQLSRNFVFPIAQFSQQINFIVMALAGAGRIFDMLDELPETDDGHVMLVDAKYDKGELVESDIHTGLWAWKCPHDDGRATYTELMGGVRFSHLYFGYGPDKTVLHDISLYAEPGQKVAFIGATGAGKTTITNLINRFYDVADGMIFYDGININDIKKSDLRLSLGIVLQDVNLFTGTVTENIRYGRLDATDDDCIAAAKLVNAHSFIEMLPDGYDTVLSGDGSGLSQGQRQLISIARAAVADPPVMILDEATSSIDTRTETIVQRGMDALMEGRTVFVIAHRLSTVQNSDVIMVLDQGRIIERGDHEKLIAEKGRYYQLYMGAFEDE